MNRNYHCPTHPPCAAGVSSSGFHCSLLCFEAGVPVVSFAFMSQSQPRDKEIDTGEKTVTLGRLTVQSRSGSFGWISCQTQAADVIPGCYRPCEAKLKSHPPPGSPPGVVWEQPALTGPTCMSNCNDDEDGSWRDVELRAVTSSWGTFVKIRKRHPFLWKCTALSQG